VIWITEEQSELNTTNEIRIISDEDLADVAGGFQVYTGGGGGKMAPGKVVGNTHVSGVDVAFGIIIGIGIGAPSLGLDWFLARI
jgi:hypothetical protein